MTHDDGPAFSDADRLHDAFARQVDRPGLEGPGLDAVLRSARHRVRRRRATVGAAAAVAAVAVGTTAAVSRWAGPERDDAGSSGFASAATATSKAPAASASGGASASASASGPASGSASGGAATTGVTPGAAGGAGTPLAGSGAATRSYQLPAAILLNQGAINGHSWRLALTFDAAQTQLCSGVSLYVDGTWSNGGGGGEDCMVDGQLMHYTPDVAHPGLSSLAIADAQHASLGGVVAGAVNPAVVSVVAQCTSGKKVNGTPFQASDGGEYYSLVFPVGSDCAHGDLLFYDASHAQVAFIGAVALGTTK